MTGRIDPGWRARSIYQSDAVGPISELALRAALVAGLLIGTGAVRVPFATRYLVMLLAVGALVLAPRGALMRMRVSLSILLFIGTFVLSSLWTIEPGATQFRMQQWIPLFLAVGLSTALLERDPIVESVRLVLRIGVVMSLFATAAFVESRTHIDPTGFNPELEGWHGFFSHKNVMAPFMVMAIVSAIRLETEPVLRWMVGIGAAVLIVGSTSVTGATALAVVLGFLWWWNVLERQSGRWTQGFVAISVVGFLGLLASAALSLQALTLASGKDLTFTGRTEIWSAVIVKIGERPWTGYGVGGLLWGPPPSPTTAAVWRDIGFSASHSHSGILDLLLQMGLIGLVIYTIFWVSTVRSVVAMRNTEPALAAVLLCFVVLQIYTSLSESTFLGAWMLWLMVMRGLGLEVSLAGKRRSSSHG